MKLKQLIVGGAVFLSALMVPYAAQADSNIYEVAYIYPEILYVRAEPFIGSKIIDQVYQGQEVEVVEKCGNWAKVCLALDSYGYINAYHFEYRTYYGNSEPLDYCDYQVDNYDYEEPGNYYEYEDYSYVEPVNDYTYTEPTNNYTYTEQYSATQDYTYTEPTNDYAYTESTDDYSYTEPTTTQTYEEENYDYTETTETQQTVTNQIAEESTSESTSSVNNNSDGQYLSDYAKQYIGNPYVWGGTSLETGADCSGFTKAVMNANGIEVNGRTAADQAAGGTQVSLSEAQAGDLIYYNNGSGVYHIAVYNGDGTVTHSSNSTTGVTVSDINYSGNAAGAVRYW